MTATTTPNIRAPHPVQTGPGLMLIWVALQGLNTGLGLFVVLFAPAFGAIAAREPGDSTPMMVAVLVLALVVVSVSILKKYLARTLDMRVPGALRRYTPEERDEMPTHVPNIVADAVECTAISLAAFVAARMAVDGDHGIAAGLLSAYAGAFIATGGAQGTQDALRHPCFRGRAIARALLRNVIPGAALLAAALLVAPQGEVPALSAFWVMAMLVVATQVLASQFRGSGSVLGRGAEGIAGGMADTFVARTDPAPTLADRERALKLAKGLLCVCAVLVALVVVIV